jgi:hypothetical protein
MKVLELTPRLHAVGITKKVQKKIPLPAGRQQHKLVLRQSGRPKNKPLVSSPFKNALAKKQVSQVKIKDNTAKEETASQYTKIMYEQTAMGKKPRASG